MEKKTECEIVQDLLLSYADDVLNPESKKLVEMHLLECGECQKRLKEIRKDMKESEENQKKEIDYLKKIRRKNKLKSILMTLGILIGLFLGVYLYKFIIFNNIINKADKTLQTNNFYKETAEILDDDQALIIKNYYKDGKYKSVLSRYSEEGEEIFSTIYTSVNSDEVISVDEENKKVTIEKGEFAKLQSREENLKHVSFISNIKDSIIAKLGTSFMMSIDTDTYEIGKEYYILRNQFEKNNRLEIWIDKETGLPLKEINRSTTKTFFPGTDIVRKISNSSQEYRYKFGIVTDEDVKVPNLEEYEVIYVNT